MHADLTTEVEAQKLAQRQGRTGRPDVIISPSEPTDTWGEEVRKAIKEKYQRMLAEGGALVIGSGAKVDLPAWAPRDMEFEKQRLLTRDAVLATMGVPPVRVGLPTANYATSREQSLTYWQNLIGLAAIMDEQLSRVAQRFDPRLNVYHDFSRIDALQASRTERLARVSSWVMLGMDAADAAAYEGFEDAPIAVAADIAADPALAALPSTTATVQDTALNGAQIASLLLIVQAVAEGTMTVDAAIAIMLVAFPTIDESEARRIAEGAIALPAADTMAGMSLRGIWLAGMLSGAARRNTATRAIVEVFTGSAAPLQLPVEMEWGEAITTSPVGEAIRGDVWRSFLTKLHIPTERRIGLAVKRFLVAQRDRIVAKLGTVESKGLGVEKDASDELISAIWDALGERKALDEAMRAVLRRAIEDAYKAGASQVNGVEINSTRIDGVVNRVLAELVVNVNDSTKAALRDIIRKSIAEGETIAEMQARIQEDAGFAPSRALRIARTEATKSVNAGSVAAYQQAEAEGIAVRKEWLTARDSHVRKSHAAIDGQVVGLAESFHTPDGDAAGYPGGFAKAENVVNCRCTVLPVVGD